MARVIGVRRIRAVVAGAALTAIVAAIVGVGSAQAGTWMRNSCTINADGSFASSDGWTGYPAGQVSTGSYNKATCAPGEAMLAGLGAQGPATANAFEVLKYSPPLGSKLVGGRAVVGLNAWANSGDAWSTAAVYTPQLWHDYTNVILQCVPIKWPCHNGGTTFFGRIDLPENRGGELFIAAGCIGGGPSNACRPSTSSAYSTVGVASANLLLSPESAPSAHDFAGSLLQPGAHGTAGLAFTAIDAGPGVYKVKVAIDGKPVYDATPNTLTGKCVPIGVDDITGALMWAWQQPCPKSQHVDLQVRTTQLRDGEHELTVTVINPARDTTIALRRTITTNNRTTVSSTLTSDKKPVGAVGTVLPDYGVVLDAPTSALTRGVRRTWSRSGLTLSGTLQQSAGVPAHGVLVTLFAKNGGEGAAQPVARTSTDAAGRWLLTAPRGPSRELSIMYGEQPDPASSKAIKIRQTVKPDITLKVRAMGRGRLRFSGRLKIAPLGNPRPLVVIQTRTRKGTWQAVGTSLRVSKTGGYSVVYDGGPNVIGGTYVFRTVAYATPMFATGVSRTKRARVR